MMAVGTTNREAPVRASLAERTRVWDPIVRGFHWLVATGCFIDLFVLDDGRSWHRAIGYVVAGALLVRMAWGFVGSRHARFRDFLPTPSGLAHYLGAVAHGSEPRFLGHNPAGGVMILLLMGLLAGVSVTGWMLTLDAFFGDERLEALHGLIADTLLASVVLHVVAALYESVRHRENLVWSMITGYKRP